MTAFMVNCIPTKERNVPRDLASEIEQYAYEGCLWDCWANFICEVDPLPLLDNETGDPGM